MTAPQPQARLALRPGLKRTRLTRPAMARVMSAGGPRAVLADKRPARHEIEELQEICLTGQCDTTKVEFRDRQHSHRELLLI